MKSKFVTVAELISALQKAAPDAAVSLDLGGWGYDRIRSVDLEKDSNGAMLPVLTPEFSHSAGLPDPAQWTQKELDTLRARTGVRRPLTINRIS